MPKRSRSRSLAYTNVKRRRYAGPSNIVRYVPRPLGARPRASTAMVGDTVPDRTMVKMAYAQFYSLSPGSGNYSLQVMRGNSIHDPDLTGVGHQPYGHDQWAQFYEYYRVVASKIEVMATCTDTAEPVLLIVTPSEDSTVIDGGNPDTYAETPYSKSKYLAVRGGQDSCTMVSYMPTQKVLGVHTIISGYDEAAAFGSNPSTGAAWFWHVMAVTRSGLGTPALETQIKVTYYVELLKRKQLTAS